MTLQQAVAVLGRVVLLLALVASGVYTLLYLWRWEWERAQIAGVFFLASLVMLSTQLILRRLDSLPGSGSPGDDTHSAATVVPSKPFAWTEPDQNTYIFLPVLLGFGVALSVLAAAAERLVAYALGGTGPGRRRPERPLPQILIVGLLVAGLVATAVTVVIARDRLMTRPETPIPGERTYLLEVKGRGIDVDVVDSCPDAGADLPRPGPRACPVSGRRAGNSTRHRHTDGGARSRTLRRRPLRRLSDRRRPRAQGRGDRPHHHGC